MLLKQIGPHAVAELSGKLGRPDDVGEHHGRHGLRASSPLRWPVRNSSISSARTVRSPAHSAKSSPGSSTHRAPGILRRGIDLADLVPRSPTRDHEPGTVSRGRRSRTSTALVISPSRRTARGLLRGASALPTTVRTRRRPHGTEQRHAGCPPPCPSHPSPVVGSPTILGRSIRLDSRRSSSPWRTSQTGSGSPPAGYATWVDRGGPGSAFPNIAARSLPVRREASTSATRSSRVGTSVRRSGGPRPRGSYEDQPREAREPREESGDARLLPEDFEGRHRPGGEQEIGARRGTHDLVGDRGAFVPGVGRWRRVHDRNRGLQRQPPQVGRRDVGPPPVPLRPPTPSYPLKVKDRLLPDKQTEP